MTASAQDVTTDLERLGVTHGDILVVHSSYRATGKAAGSPLGFLTALAAAVGPQGTLLLPNLNISQEFTARNPPCWDLKNGSLIKTLGVLAQVFKERMATAFSLHPTHSMMGCGPAAEAILKNHELAGVPCGQGTPWWNAARAGAKILLIGVGQDRNTTIHCAEELMPESRRLTSQPVEGTVIVDGQTIAVSSKMHRWDVDADFSVLTDEAAGVLARGPVALAESILLNAEALIQLVVDQLTADADYFGTSGRL